MIEDLLDKLELHVPHYLTAPDRRQLLQQLREAKGKDFYWESTEHEILQGDGWKGFVLFNFDDGTTKSVSGVVISNSCDIDEKNGIEDGQAIVFAPLISVDRYLDALGKNGWSPEEVTRRKEDIVGQRISSFFYLPSPPAVGYDLLVRLDAVTSNPIRFHKRQEGRSRLFRLSQYGFYYFLIKLSIHFTRVGEGVRRMP